MKRIFVNTSIYTIGNILPKAVGFILLPIYTRYLSPADYGIVSSMMVLQTILAVFFSMCLERSIYRLYWDNKTESAKRNFLGTITISIAAIAFSILSLLFIFNHYVGLIYKSINFYPFYVYAILIGFISVFSLIPCIYFQLKERAGIFVTLSISQFIANSSLILWFIIAEREGAAGYLKGQVIGASLLLPLYLYIGYRIINFKFQFSILKESLLFSLPLIPTIMCAWILNLSDRIFIERYFSLEEVGIYSLGYKIAGLVGIVSGAIAMAYGPVFFRLVNSDDQLQVRKTIDRYNHVYLMAIILMSFFIAFFAKEVIILAFDNRYTVAHLFVGLISFSYLFSQAAGITSLYFQQSKKMKEVMVIALLIAGINVILNFLLIPNFGAYGAAYATILSFILGFVLSYLYTKRFCFFIPFQWGRLIPLVGILIFVFVFFQYVLILDVVVSLIVKIIIVGIGSLFFMKKYYPQIRAMMAK